MNFLEGRLVEVDGSLFLTDGEGTLPWPNDRTNGGASRGTWRWASGRSRYGSGSGERGASA